MRYYRDSRSDLDRLARVLVPAMDGKMQIPLAEIADVEAATGPSMLRNENGMLTAMSTWTSPAATWAAMWPKPSAPYADQWQLPAGYSLAWSGQYEAMERVRERLKLVLPLTLFLIFLLLYMNTQSTAKTLHRSCSPCRSRPSARSGCSTCSATT